ncbi:MAG: alkaline phosphatase family protein [Vulcanimicrobiaceae bacterium]
MWYRLAGVLAAALGIAACSSGSSTPSGPTLAKPGVYAHVIVLIQENRSFDNMFAGGGISGADVATFGYNSHCSTPNVVTTCGQVPLHAQSFNSYDPDHAHASIVSEWNNGLMNGFDTESTFTAPLVPDPQPPPSPNPQTYVYAYLPPSEIAPYLMLAQTYSLSDRMFSSGLSPSFPGHEFLVAGLGPADDPKDDTGQPTKSAWGCPEPLTDSVELFDGSNVSPCLTAPTIADLLDAKDVSWKYYTFETPPGVSGVFDAYENSFAAVKRIYNSSEYQAKVVPRNSFFDDLAGGTLPAVAWITPNGSASDHAAVAISGDGPYWVAEIYEAIAQNPAYYGNTAIVVTWDDSGAWYDHVPPPMPLRPLPAPYGAYEGSALGMRVPLIFIAANARPGVSHTVRSFGSILGFIENNFSLGNLGAQDVGTDALGDLYNPNPTPTIAPIPRSQLEARSRRVYSIDYFRRQAETPADDQ